jgi:putative SOS response-associated peptidase YedK
VPQKARTPRSGYRVGCEHRRCWSGDGKAAITSFSIVTTDAALSTVKVHDRMPLVLEEGQFDDGMRGPHELAAEMMKSYGGAIDQWEVRPEVGNVRNNKLELLDRIGLL